VFGEGGGRVAKKKPAANPAGLTEEELRQVEAADRLLRAVADALKAAELPIRELTIATDADGGVSIFGVTRSEPAKRRADAIARGVPGVAQLSNTIIVLAEPGPAPDRGGTKRKRGTRPPHRRGG
jgi:osmotically-inducible protein OsmY